VSEAFGSRVVDRDGHVVDPADDPERAQLDRHPRPARPGEVVETASAEPAEIEWWYANCLIESPGSPVDGCALIASFVRFRGALEEGRFVLISPDTGTVLDFGTGRLTEGTMSTSSRVVDVAIGPNYLRGPYPHYALHVENSSGLRGCSVDMSLQALSKPEELVHVGSQFKHFGVFRLGVRGTIILDDHTHHFTGLGFFEHVYGELGWHQPLRPGVVRSTGWNWYFSPATGPDEAIVEFWGFRTSDDPQPRPYVSVSLDGENFIRFTTGAVEVLEERELDGLSYPHRLRITDRNESGELDLVVTRRDAAHHTSSKPGRSTRLFFVTGLATFEGELCTGETVVRLDGRAFGSAYRRWHS
jgi:hypothetical protein